jgi:hypothetical protein
MTTQSARQGFPFLAAGQAQKELVHNEALALIDIATNVAVLSADVSDPPLSPATGACWIVGIDATGAWAGRDGSIACWTSGGWRFAAPVDGMRAWVVDQASWAERIDGAWQIGIVYAASVRAGGVQVVGARGPAIDDPAGGAVIDAQARDAVAAILSSLRDHGLIESE